VHNFQSGYTSSRPNENEINTHTTLKTNVKDTHYHLTTGWISIDYKTNTVACIVEANGRADGNVQTQEHIKRCEREWKHTNNQHQQKRIETP
jgi:hypothetical protein